MGSHRHLVLAVVIGTALATPVAAQEFDEASSPLFERFKFSGFGFLPETSTTIRFDQVDGDLGTELDFEDDLGLDDREFLPAGVVSWRLGRQTRLEGSFFTLSREATREIDVEIDFGDETFERDVEVGTFFDTDILRASFFYSFLHDPQAELAVGLGLHLLWVDLGLEAGDIERSVETDVTAPLPVLSVHGAYAFSPKFLLNGTGQLFALEIDRYDGELINLYGGFEYFFSPVVGATLGYDFYSIDLDVTGEREEFEGKIDFTYHGPRIGLVLRVL